MKSEQISMRLAPLASLASILAFYTCATSGVDLPVIRDFPSIQSAIEAAAALQVTVRPDEGDPTPSTSINLGVYDDISDPPRATTSLHARSIPEGAILTWTEFDGSQTYQLSRAINLSGPFVVIASGTFVSLDLGRRS